ncbi:MAG: hypothetical protein K0R10_2922 [Alphaproteobacteria bacterium]|jgi:putative membrane protein|nr:hypothetical protein [Alphaproteobacteria bacterium]
MKTAKSKNSGDKCDPQVFFSAERSALSWNRTAITLMAFGFTIERFGFFMQLQQHAENSPMPKETTTMSYWVGLVFILLGVLFSSLAAWQFRDIVKTMDTSELPRGYHTHMPFFVNLIVAIIAAAMAFFLLGTLVHDLTNGTNPAPA